ncbi:hypothetical protein FISHEDRAFT_66233 [Fistulina hepatica ATCC 64428]|uniref:RINT-1 family protein n=1 Tax=Fistulina hepatica ATCC 64428 TaxID=1128425 RepID=A0A0D7A7S1_9AGAR|nr:hypothetical protein FISHEDRAFT_66233 [Fistulina hepatica ATCC 64428]
MATVSLQIRSLLSSPDQNSTQDEALEFLNSHFRTCNDLSELGAALDDARGEHDALESQMHESEVQLKAFLLQARASTLEHLDTAQALSLQRHTLTDELAALTEELLSVMWSGPGSATLLEDLETRHRGLKELQSIYDYVAIVERALSLSKSVVSAISSSAETPITSSMLSGYRTLQKLISQVSEVCSIVADDSGQQKLNLVLFLERTRDKCWSDVKEALSTILLSAADNLNWPMTVDYASVHVEDRKHFEQAFLNMLRLQDIGADINPPSEERKGKDGLYPLQTLVRPVAQRFKYHFDSTRPTNRLDKPEWYFTHVLNTCHEHRPFMDSVIQKLLSSTQYCNISAWREFARLLLPMLTRKLSRTVPMLLSHPSLLAHTIYQALSFDAVLVAQGFELQETMVEPESIPRSSPAGWEISEIILGKNKYFDAWMEAEKQFAEQQYHEAISAADAWQITDDEMEESSSTTQSLRSTYSARRVKVLTEQVTDRYSSLPRFDQRTRFFKSVQVPILDQYRARIASSMDAFETLSSALVRSVPGALTVSFGGSQDGGTTVDVRRLTSGVEGVQRLCKALLSAKYIANALREWGEELFFLELWSEIHTQPALREIVSSIGVLPRTVVSGGSVPSDTIFAKLTSQYDGLVSRAQDLIVQQVCSEVENGLRAHFMVSADDETVTNGEFSLSQTLLGPIALLSAHLAYLRSVLPSVMLSSVYRRIVTNLSEHILQRQVLYRGKFSRAEGRRMCTEWELWVEACHMALGDVLTGGRERVESPWFKLLEAAKLVAMDMESDAWRQIVDATTNPQKDAQVWEKTMMDLLGQCDIPRSDVARIFDCRR